MVEVGEEVRQVEEVDEEVGVDVEEVERTVIALGRYSRRRKMIMWRYRWWRR